MGFKTTSFFALTALLYCLPVNFVSEKAWHLFIIFLATIISVIFQIFPIVLSAIFGLTSCLVLGILDIKTQALYGFSTPIVWLIGSVFFIGRGFVNSRLGERIAYFFIYYTAKTPLRLAYSLMLTELVVAPFIPSNTARSGGILLPILESISNAFKRSFSKPEQDKMNAFLFQTVFHSSVSSSALFFTGTVSNSLAASFAKIQGVEFDWITWFTITCIPAGLCLCLAPLFVYAMEHPNVKIPKSFQLLAKSKLDELGAFSFKEYLMVFILVLLLFLWIYGDSLGLHAASVAILGVVLCLLTGAITFSEILAEDKAWETILWLSILITMSTYLKEFGFIAMINQYAVQAISGLSFTLAAFLILAGYFWIGYLFASNSSHISALYSSFLGILLIIGMNPVLAGVILAVFSVLFASLTHYGSTAGSILFSAGFVKMEKWWKTGLFVGFMNFWIWIIIGSLWWKFLGYL
ncbi:MAG: DASS family sodium-coupled anion symporter [Alphaproteobacteria bacterium]|nr:MAG: DASS family sodium-coupled anion symporter [Alphaproteobacteria bacterium]